MSLLAHRGTTTKPRAVRQNRPLARPSCSPPPIRAVSLPASVYEVWQHRPCLICGKLGACAHREREVDQAELEVMWADWRARENLRARMEPQSFHSPEER
jgi:hypothetical protein